MRIARDLGYTLSELTQRISREELQLWATLYEVEYAEEEQMHRKMKRR